MQQCNERYATLQRAVMQQQRAVCNIATCGNAALQRAVCNMATSGNAALQRAVSNIATSGMQRCKDYYYYYYYLFTIIIMNWRRTQGSCGSHGAEEIHKDHICDSLEPYRNGDVHKEVVGLHKPTDKHKDHICVSGW